MDRKLLTSQQGFLSKTAGSFSGVPQRTVQAWTEAGFIIPEISDTSGTGKRREYSVINLIQIAVLKALADERISHVVMSMVSEQFQNKKIIRHLEEEESYLILRRGRDQGLKKIAEPDVAFYSFSKGEFEGEEWVKLTRATESDKVIIVNLSRIAERILNQL